MSAMTPQHLREMVDAATPGPWSYMATGEKDNSWAVGSAVWPDDSPVVGEINEQEAARWDAAGQPDDPEACQATVVDAVCFSARDLGPLADAALIALAPELARLCAEQHEWLSHNAPEDHHPTCAIALPQAECDCGYEDAERLLAAFAALGEPASGEEGA